MNPTWGHFWNKPQNVRLFPPANGSQEKGEGAGGWRVAGWHSDILQLISEVLSVGVHVDFTDEWIAIENGRNIFASARDVDLKVSFIILTNDWCFPWNRFSPTERSRFWGKIIMKGHVFYRKVTVSNDYGPFCWDKRAEITMKAWWGKYGLSICHKYWRIFGKYPARCQNWWFYLYNFVYIFSILMTSRVSVINISNFAYRRGMRGADLNSAVKLSAKLMDSPIRLCRFFSKCHSTSKDCPGSEWGEYQNLWSRIRSSSLPHFVCVCVMTVLLLQI